MRRVMVGIILTFLVMEFGWSQNYSFVLCEGNFNSTNASLWQIKDYSTLIGPVHWNFQNNPLGDVAQTMKIYQDKLYIVVNNSNTIEVMNLDRDGAKYSYTINVPTSGPRDMAFYESRAFVSCWYLKGILVIDLLAGNVIDTIPLNCLPENIVINNDRMYVSIAMKADWSADERVMVFDLSQENYPLQEEFQVIPGPNQLLLKDDYLYVLSTYYDQSWNTYTGTSRINLLTKEVIKKEHGLSTNFCDDFALINGKVYRTFNKKIVPLTDSLTFDFDKAIGEYSSIYAMAFDGEYIFLGLSDFSAPDQVLIVDTLGNLVKTFNVGACPGTFAFYQAQVTGVNQDSEITKAQDFALAEIYPNPFNSQATIKIHLKERHRVKIAIYNLTGRKVRELFEGSLEAGIHCFYWDGTSVNREHMPSGIYLLKIEGINASRAAKMLLVK